MGQLIVVQYSYLPVVTFFKGRTLIFFVIDLTDAEKPVSDTLILWYSILFDF